MSAARITVALRRLLGLTIASPARASAPARHANRFRPMLEMCEYRLTPVIGGGVVVDVVALSNPAEGGTATLEFTRTGFTTASLTASYSVTGTATSGTDYTALSGTVTFPVGVSTVDVIVTTLADLVVDDGETVVATVVTGTGYSPGSSYIATMTISDVSTTAVTISYDVAETQTLTATTGVGLLDNYTLSAFGSSLAVTSLTVPGYSSPVTPGTPLSLTGWGALAIAADGSFVFAPDSSATGTLTIGFRFSDGTNVGRGSVALCVGGSGEEFEENELAAAPAGTLTYERSLGGLADLGSYEDFTVNSVPFNSAFVGGAGAASVVYVTFGIELADVDSVATVLLPQSLDDWRILHSTVNKFTFLDGQELTAHIVDVRCALYTAINDIGDALNGGYSTSTVKNQIDFWFKGNGQGASSNAPTQTQAEAVLSNYQSVALNLDVSTIVYESDKHSNDPQVMVWFGYYVGSKIYMAPLYWGYEDENIGWVDATAVDRFGTVIHELAHTSFGADDKGDYFDTQNSYDPMATAADWGLNTNTTAILMNNADSYAGYLTKYYYL